MEHPAEGKPIGREPSYVTEKRHSVGRKEPFLIYDDPHRAKSNKHPIMKNPLPSSHRSALRALVCVCV
jgi:hypothetical protein